MKHLGDITLIRGDEIEPVDCIIGGSPCQDLSIAGKRAGLSGTAPGCVGITNRGSVTGVASETLRSGSHGALPMVAKMYALDAVSSNSMRSANPHSGFHEEGVVKTLQAGGVDPTCNQGGNVIVQPVICLQGNGIDRADTAGCNGRGWRENVSYTLNTIDRPAVCYDMTHASDVIRDCGEVSPTLQGRMGTGGNQIPLCIGNGQADQLRCQTRVGALNCMHDQQCVVSTGVVRRLTPLECERLQGFPDGWTDIGDWIDTKGKKHKSADAPRYKALGNSIALPFWLWMLRRMSKYLPAGAKMDSLFDGIGGFPLCWETIHGRGSARWASEIEEFPIAVTKLRFPEDE